jgi:hypothetical protein
VSTQKSLVGADDMWIIENPTKGVESYTVDLPTQKVVVIGPIDHDTLREMIKKTGKEVTEARSFDHELGL